MPLPPANPPDDRDTRVFWSQIRTTLRVTFTLLSVAASMWLVVQLRMVLMLLVVSILFYHVFAPIIIGLEHRGLPRVRAVVLVYAVLLTGAVGIGFAVGPRSIVQLRELIDGLPEYTEMLRVKTQHADGLLAKHNLVPAVHAAVERARPFIEAHLAVLFVGLLGVLKLLPWIVLVPAVAFFFLADPARFRTFFLEMLPKGRVRWRGAEFVTEINQQLAFYVRAQLIACLFIGTVCCIGFSVIGLNYALLIGTIAAVVEFIPMIGPAFIMIVATSVAALQLPGHPLVVLGFLAALRFVHDQFVYPSLIARNVKLHALAILLALACGSQLGGVAGLFFAIPLTAVFMVSRRYLAQHLGAEGILAELLRSPEPADILAVDAASVTPPPPEPAARNAAKTQLAFVRAVIVDNDADSRELLESVLTYAGAQVWQAGSAEEALRLVREHLPDVLISDIGMPDADGFDLIHRVRELPPKEGGLTPAAALTGYTTEEDRVRAELAGFQLHLRKPIQRNALLAAVAALANRRPSMERGLATADGAILRPPASSR